MRFSRLAPVALTGALALAAPGVASAADVSPPTNVVLAGVADQQHVRGALTLSATAADDTGIARIEFYANGVKVAADQIAPYTGGLDTGQFPDGSTVTLFARAFDAAGNSADSPPVTFLADRSTHVAIVGGIADNAVTSAVTPSIAFSYDNDVVSVLCKLDGGVLSAQQCSSPTTLAFPNATEGQHTFLVKVLDSVGNAAQVQRSFRVDRTPPALAFTSGPQEGATVSTSDVTFGFTAADEGGGVTFTCALDVALPGPCTSASTFALTGLTDGDRGITVRATDQAGNVSVATRHFMVSLAPPSTGGGGAGDGGSPPGPTSTPEPTAAPTPAPTPMPSPAGGTGGVGGPVAPSAQAADTDVAITVGKIARAGKHRYVVKVACATACTWSAQLDGEWGHITKLVKGSSRAGIATSKPIKIPKKAGGNIGLVVGDLHVKASSPGLTPADVKLPVKFMMPSR